MGSLALRFLVTKNPACREYAIELGLALQVTNILRDVEKDLANGRIYLPREDMARFHYAKKISPRAPTTIDSSGSCSSRRVAHTNIFAGPPPSSPREDRRSMVGAQIMASIYHALLRQMEQDQVSRFRSPIRAEQAREISCTSAGSC